MIPLRLELAGITRFADPVVVDFASMPAGLVAVAGGNGAGKTSLLESILLAIYGTLPTRPGSVYEYLCSEHAHVELLVEYDGHVWRFRREFRRKQRKASATVWIDDEPQNSDGKVGEVDDVVALRWPPLSQVLASAFAAQGGAGSFLSLKPAARKELVVRMLGLDRLQVLAKGAQEELTAAARVLDLAGARVQECERSAARLTEARAALVDAQARTAEAIVAHDADVATLSEARKVGEAADAEEASARAASLAAAGKVDEADAAEAEAKAAFASASERYLLAKRRADQLASLRELAAKAPELQARSEAHESLRRKRGVLASFVETDADALRAQLADAEEAGKEAEGLVAAYDAAAARVDQLQASAEQERTIGKEIQRAEEYAPKLKSVPCGGGVLRDLEDDVDCSTCPLIAQAVQAAHVLPGLREDLEFVEGSAADLSEAMKERDAIAGRLTTLRSKSAGAAALRERLASEDEKERAREALRAEIDALRDAAGAPVDAHELTEALDAVQRVHAATEAAGALGARKELQENARQAHEGAKMASSAAQALYREAREAWVAAEVEATTARTPWFTAKRAEAASAATLADAQAAEARAFGAAGALEHAEEDLEVAREALKKANEAHEDTKLLANALGRDGVQAMELDAVGPAVSATATEILQVVYGPRFAVQLVTQVKKAGAAGRRGETKEVFDVRVLDTERGTDGPAERLSGGEQVVVSEALKLALAIFAAQSGAARLKTLIRDESDGALDAERALNYPAMLRRAQVLGGFERVLLVSHRPDNVTACDAVLDVRDGQARLSLT